MGRAPPTQIVKPGATFCVRVPSGGPGAIVNVPHPTMKGQLVAVNVPATAKVGQAMLVPLPTGTPKPVELVEPDAGTTGVAVVGGLAVAGAILGQHISDEGW